MTILLGWFMKLSTTSKINGSQWCLNMVQHAKPTNRWSIGIEPSKMYWTQWTWGHFKLPVTHVCTSARPHQLVLRTHFLVQNHLCHRQTVPGSALSSGFHRLCVKYLRTPMVNQQHTGPLNCISPKKWVWINTYENSIFRGMNIHLLAILMWTTGVLLVLTHCHVFPSLADLFHSCSCFKVPFSLIHILGCSWLYGYIPIISP